MLSNTATPKYYGIFRERVLNGEIPVNEEVSLEMNRIDRLIRNPKYYYDPEPVECYIRFCESELTLTDGSDLFLLDSFKLWAEQVYCWYYYVTKSVYVLNKHNRGGHYATKRVKKRLINRQYLIIGRGAAKTLYGETNHAYWLVCNPKSTHQIATAYTMKQAEEAINPLKTAITKSRGPLFKFMTKGSIQNTTGSMANRPKLASTKKGVENFSTNSLLETRPMSIDALQGFSSAMNTVDEWLSSDIREDPIIALCQGAEKCDDYLLIAMSSEGNVRNGIGDTIKKDLAAILHGEYTNDHVSIWWYKLDSIKELPMREMWLKANPNLGANVSFETYENEYNEAMANPARKNEIIAKRFGIPLEGLTFYFTYDEIQLHRKQDYWQMPCALGADLSQGDDFCAFTFLFPLKHGFGVKCRAYITERTLMKLHSSMRDKYDEFVEEGTLIVMPGSVLDIMSIYDDLDQHIIETGYDVRCFGYDPYNAKEFVERWERENGPFGITKVIQGRRTETVPLGEIKQLAEDRLLFFDEVLMHFAMGNAVVMEDINGNRQLVKKRHEDKIDPVSALMDAYVSYKAFKENFE